MTEMTRPTASVGVALLLVCFSNSLFAKAGFEANRDDTTRFQHHISAYLGYLEHHGRQKTLGRPLRQFELISAVYGSREHRPIWTDDQGMTASAMALLARIDTLGDHALTPAYFHQQALTELAQRGGGLAARVQAELLLSDAWLELYRALRPAEPATRADVFSTLGSQDPLAALDARLPADPQYQALVELMGRLRGTTADHLPELGADLLQRGDHGAEVTGLTAHLVQAGLLDVASEEFGSAVESAVLRFQQNYGLHADGMAGPATLAMLNRVNRDLRSLVAINLARLRERPGIATAHHIRVNTAAQTLEYLVNGEPAARMKVIVGRDDRQTPELHSSLEELVINPSWNVPTKLAVRDILPQIRNNPDWLKENHFLVRADWSPGAPIVDPDSIDWQAYGWHDFPFRLQQQPGPHNALGQIKFLFPNPYAVFLHDTAHAELFTQDVRLFSSGCVRVENPLQLAGLILEQQSGWDLARLQQALAAGDNLRIALENPVTVELHYQTVWVDAAGQVQIRPDIYARDASLLARLRDAGQAPASLLAANSEPALELASAAPQPAN